jgi:ribonuclease HI
MVTTIYTDGACRGNPGPGGCAAIVDNGQVKTELSRGYRWTTNNRMEILSVIRAIETIDTGGPVHLVSDSQYVLNTLSKNWISGWKRKNWISTTRQPVKNRDLWECLDDLISKRAMTYEWVRGHASHPLNNRCDEMAVAAALSDKLFIDSGYEAERPFPSEISSPVVKYTSVASPMTAVVSPGQVEFPGFF